MKKQIRALALAVLFALSLLPAAGFAAENVATVNGTCYTSLQDALNAAVQVPSGTATVEILKDVTLTEWTPVYFNSYPPSGSNTVIIHGNDHTIYDLPDMLFVGTWTGTKLEINDLTIDGAAISHNTDSQGTAAFIGTVSCTQTVTLDNCHVINSEITGGDWTGAFVGYAAGYSNQGDGPVFTTVTISNCTVSNNEIVGGGSTGGVVGHATGDAWTTFAVTDTTIVDNVITCTDDSSNKAGSVMGTVGAAGSSVVADRTGSVQVDANVGENTVTSNGTVITTIYGRQGTPNGKLEITGGTYKYEPVAESDKRADFASAPQGSYTVGPLVTPAYAGPVMNWVKVNAANNGVVKSGPLAASAGATVTLYPKAAEGYVLDTVEVLDAEGNAVQLDGLKFAIPAGGVTVNATFKLAQ